MKLADRRIARVVRGAQDLPGQHLFQYIVENSDRRAIRSQDVNDYIRQATGADFLVQAFSDMGRHDQRGRPFRRPAIAGHKSETKRAMNEIIDLVAHRLGNTRAVCRQCYIHPTVIECGLLAGFLKRWKGRGVHSASRFQASIGRRLWSSNGCRQSELRKPIMKAPAAGGDSTCLPAWGKSQAMRYVAHSCHVMLQCTISAKSPYP